MIRIAAIAVVCLLAGFSTARWLDSEALVNADSQAAPSFDSTGPLEERVGLLERAISEERQARQLLQEELVFLNDELERVQALAEDVPDAGAGRDPGETGRDATVADRRANIAARRSAEGRAARLVAAGFAEDRAAWIVRRESQLQMEALQARYDAEQSGDSENRVEAWRAQSAALRTELGDADYEQYLAATGRTTSVSVSSVMDSSPAQGAGLRPGDRIVSYGGERIFNMSDLNRATLDGRPGETVIVEVVRNGTRLQVPLPRGPVGITASGRFGS